MTKVNFQFKIYNLKFIILFVALPLLAIGCNNSQLAQTKVHTTKVAVAGHILDAEIADTEDTREQGLSNRASLPANIGMLFVFELPGHYAFWMKDMQFPIDFIWIRAGEVIAIFSDIPPEPGVADLKLHTYMPDEMYDSVLEVNANWAESHGIQVGDSVDVAR